MKAAYIGQFTRAFTDDSQRDLVVSAVNLFGTDRDADHDTIMDAAAGYVLPLVEKAMRAFGPNDARGKLLMEFHSRIEDALSEVEGDVFAEIVSEAEEAFWKVVAERYRATGIVSGDLPPAAHDEFRDATLNAVGAWLAANRPRVPQTNDSAAVQIAARGDDGVDFADKWDPERDFAASVERAHNLLPLGWSVTYEYPGYFAFRHKERPNFLILATPDHNEDGTIAVDAQDDHGKQIDGYEDIAWPLADRMASPDRTTRAVRFLTLLKPVLERSSPRKLVVEFDVTGWTSVQIAALALDAAVQSEGDGGHPDASVLRNEVVSQ